jgi:hypothetical protein
LHSALRTSYPRPPLFSGPTSSWPLAAPVPLHLPASCPPQVVVIPIVNSKMTPAAREAMLARTQATVEELRAAGVRVTSDARENYTPGWKYNYWELKVRKGGSRGGGSCTATRPGGSATTGSSRCGKGEVVVERWPRWRRQRAGTDPGGRTALAGGPAIRRSHHAARLAPPPPPPRARARAGRAAAHRAGPS